MVRSRPLPKHIQIAESVIREIQAGILSDGARLPTEKNMARQYEVAVGTLRKALALLEEKGLLVRKQGSGNYIKSQPLVDSVYSLFRLELTEGGGLPSAEILSVERRIKPQDTPAFGSSLQAHCITRIRALDNLPVALEEIWLDGDQASHMDPRDISDSLYHYYKYSLGLIITRAHDRVSAAPLPAWTPNEFHLSAGQMTGLVERLSFDQNGHPVEFSRNWFDPQRCQYVARL